MRPLFSISRALRWAAIPGLFALLAACSDSSSPAADDRLHPATNGASESASGACDALLNAYQTTAASLQCVGTTPICPEFLGQFTDVTCANVDQGTVEGCAKFIAQQTSCDDLAAAQSDCVVEPLGC